MKPVKIFFFMQFKTTVRLLFFQLQIVQEMFSRKTFEWPYFEYRDVSYTPRCATLKAGRSAIRACLYFFKEVLAV